MSKMELRPAGSGGQGVILASVILAEAAIIAGKNTAQSQSYGPEARGGACKAETIISDSSIGYTKVQHPDFLMVLNQAALEKYGKNVPEDCLVMMDSGLTAIPELENHRVVSYPILKTAKEKVGRLQTANIVAVGCINSLLNLVDDESIKKAVLMHIPAGTEKLNVKALEAGIALTKKPKAKTAETKTEPSGEPGPAAKADAAQIA